MNVPKTIGRYTIEKTLGAGAMGLVFLGHDPQLDRAVAIKTIRDLEALRQAGSQFLERFRNEARAAARLHHPSIVQVYDAGEDEDVGPFLVFEYVAGSTLKEHIRAEGPLDPAQVLRVAEEIGRALDAAHARDILHRDVKPENILITDSGQTKLADFGIARIPNAALTGEGQFLGTPCYAAPETLERGEYSPRSDLFSFATVLFELITAQRAFPGNDAVGVAHKVIHDPAPRPSELAVDRDIPPAVDALFRTALSKRPKDRFGSGTELVGELMRAYGCEAPTLKPGALKRLRASLGLGPDQPADRNGTTPGTANWIGWILAALVGIGGFLLFANRGPAPSTDDGSNVPQLGAEPHSGRRRAPTAGYTGAKDGSVRVDASAAADGSQALDANGVDGSATDATASEPALSAHEREEMAKDALEAARRHLKRKRYPQARAALERARSYDPSNPSVDELAAQIPEP